MATQIDKEVAQRLEQGLLDLLHYALAVEPVNEPEGRVRKAVRELIYLIGDYEEFDSPLLHNIAYSPFNDPDRKED